jgi:hypothetical protein
VHEVAAADRPHDIHVGFDLPLAIDEHDVVEPGGGEHLLEIERRLEAEAERGRAVHPAAGGADLGSDARLRRRAALVEHDE